MPSHTPQTFFVYITIGSFTQLIFCLISALQSIVQRDVLPIYADAADIENGKFWLFLVTSKKIKGKKIFLRGRYFQLKSVNENGNVYMLTSKETYDVEAKSILRLDVNSDDYFVLPKFDLVSENYFVPRRVVDICDTEVDNLLR